MVILFLEIFAVSSAILYLILAAKEDVRCWYAALFSSILYMYIMHTAGLIMESFLQIFYICMAIYGWYIWSNKINVGQELKITSWKKQYHHLRRFGIILYPNQGTVDTISQCVFGEFILGI